MNILRFLMAAESKTRAISQETAKVIETIKLIVVIAILLCAVFIIVSVMLQESNTNGMTGITGETDTFYNRNKSKSMQGKIKKITIFVSIAILVLCLAYLVLATIYTA